MKSNRNVIIFGESGSGKSSLVNLLLGQDRAAVSSRAIGCTFTFERYETPNFNLYDTVGLSEGSNGTVKQEFAVKELIALLKSLEDGVSLLVFVIEKGRIKKSLKDNYKLFVDTICMKKVPVLLVITHCEMESVPGKWWEENKSHFEKYGMKFDAVVTGSALQPSSAPELMRETIKEMNNTTVAELLEAIGKVILHTSWKAEGGWSNWFYAIVKGVAQIIGKVFNNALSSKAGSEKTKERSEYVFTMVEYFESQGYESMQAFDMAQQIVSNGQLDL